MKIANLKIGARVGCGFGMVILLLIIVVAISLVRMHEMKRRVDNILDDLFRQVTLANELKYNVSIIHQRVRNVVIDGDTSGVKREGEIVESIRKKNSELLKQLDVAITTKQARDLLSRINEASALNAAVEAARAGEQGRGFAVVASEVRVLAQRSLSAAKEIKSLIDDSVGKVDIGARQVDQAGSTMQEVVESVKRVTDIMGKIALASREQTAGIEQINRAVTNMDTTTQKNAAMVDEAASSAQALQEQADALERAVSIFRLGELVVADAVETKSS